MLNFALEITRRAAELTTLIQDEMVTPALDKADRSPVTVADLAVQAYVAAKLEEFCPEIPLVGEESSDVFASDAGQETLMAVTDYVARLIPAATPEDVCRWIDRGNAEGGATGQFWTLDPVDGTKGFLRREQYAVALALLEDGCVKLGVLGCPRLSLDGENTGVLAYAERGEGAWFTQLAANDANTPYRLRVSDISDVNQSRALRSVESGHTNVSQMDILMQKMGVSAEPVRMDSQAKYVVLAAGRGDLLFRLLSSKMPDYEERIWDQAAGSIIVQEAGGRITDLAGRPLDFTQGRTLKNNRGICASNGLLHDAAIQALADF